MTKKKECDMVHLEDYPQAVKIVEEILSKKGIAELKIGKFGLMVSETKRLTKYSQKPQ